MDLTETHRNSPTKQCIRDGESMNSQCVVNADRFSELPEALIVQILCFLPTKVAIATSVLSKQWKSHWTMIPKLKFDSFHLKLVDVYKSLLSHKAPVLQSFHLKLRVNECSSAVDIEILIETVFTRKVRKLVLQVGFRIASFTFPRCLYECETLETLELKFSVIMNVPSSVSLKSLRTLLLEVVDFKDDESVVNLLSGCPKLENLVVRRDPNSNAKTFTIAVPSLQRLTIHNSNGGTNHWGYVINAPSLKYLKMEGSKAFESCLIENIPKLVEVEIMNVSKIFDEELLGSFTSVKRLCLALSPSQSTFPTGSIFCHLVYLELHTTIKAWWNLLTLMLDRSPKLQVLKLIDPEHRRWRKYHVPHIEWNQPKKVPECLLFHLKTFMWEGYEWKRDDEILVAKYILSNTNHLKRATFSSKHMRSDEDRLVVVKDLKSVVKAPNSCQLQFKMKHIY